MKTLEEAFLSKYPNRGVILSYFEQANDCPALWENLTKIRLICFVNYLVTKFSKNSARQYAAKFKALLNEYSEENIIPCKDFNKILSIKKEVSTNVFLTSDELIKLEKVGVCSDTEELVKFQFLIGCYTGARHSDYCRFTETNISNGVLSYVSQKTKIQAIIPLKPFVATRVKGVSAGRTISDKQFNEVIRRLCKRAGIRSKVKLFRASEEESGEKWEFVSSHTARRSFASNLYLLGADIYSISRMMGHSNVTQTETYIAVQLKKLPDAVMEYFK